METKIENRSKDIMFVTNYTININNTTIFRTVNMDLILAIMRNIDELSLVDVIFFIDVVNGNKYKTKYNVYIK